MVNHIVTKSQNKLLYKILYNSKYLGTSWLNNEIKKMIYLGDKVRETELRTLADELLEMVGQYEE